MYAYVFVYIYVEHVSMYIHVYMCIYANVSMGNLVYIFCIYIYV